MPPMPYFLSAHASLNSQHMVAARFPIVFYVPPGQILQHDRAFQIFGNLVRQVVPGGKVDHTVQTDEPVPDYAIWDLSEFPDHSGVFPVGSDHASISLAGYTKQAPLKLSELADRLQASPSPASRLYWVACA